MNRVPVPRKVWISGIYLRSVTMYLPLCVLLIRLGLVLLLPIVLLLIEVFCFRIYCSARKGYARPLLLLCYLSVGDIIWFICALCFGMLSTLMPVWGYAGMFTLWFIVIGVQVYISRRIATSLKPDSDISAILCAVEIGKSGKYAVLWKMDSILAIWVALGLIGVGLIGVMVNYVLDYENWFLLSLSTGFLGLSCGFSPQIRALLLEVMKSSRQ